MAFTMFRFSSLLTVKMPSHLLHHGQEHVLPKTWSPGLHLAGAAWPLNPSPSAFPLIGARLGTAHPLTDDEGALRRHPMAGNNLDGLSLGGGGTHNLGGASIGSSRGVGPDEDQWSRSRPFSYKELSGGRPAKGRPNRVWRRRIVREELLVNLISYD